MFTWKIAILGLSLLALLSSCEGVDTSPNRQSRTVVSAEGGFFCSTFVGWGGPQHHNFANRIIRTFDYVRRVRSAFPDVVATYIDFRSGAAITLTASGKCTSTAGKLVAAAKQGSTSDHPHISRPFPPITLNVDAYSKQARSLSEILRSVSPGKALEDCSLSALLTRTQRPEEDRDFHAKLAEARGIFGVPILFVAQENSRLYISFHQQCESRHNMMKALQIIISQDKNVEVSIVSTREVTNEELRLVYRDVM